MSKKFNILITAIIFLNLSLPTQAFISKPLPIVDSGNFQYKTKNLCATAPETRVLTQKDFVNGAYYFQGTGSYALGEDIRGNISITNSSNLSINLCGHTVSNKVGNAGSIFTISESDNISISNGRITGGTRGVFASSVSDLSISGVDFSGQNIAVASYETGGSLDLNNNSVSNSIQAFHITTGRSASAVNVQKNDIKINKCRDDFETKSCSPVSAVDIAMEESTTLNFKSNTINFYNKYKGKFKTEIKDFAGLQYNFNNFDTDNVVEISSNKIDGAVYGIYSAVPTTASSVKIRDNEFEGISGQGAGIMAMEYIILLEVYNNDFSNYGNALKLGRVTGGTVILGSYGQNQYCSIDHSIVVKYPNANSVRENSPWINSCR